MKETALIMESAGLPILLHKAPNTRDLGGYPTLEGKKLRTGRLVRSGTLSDMTEEDKDKLLAHCNLKNIIDLRTTAEVNSAPDPVLSGVKAISLAVLENDIPGISVGNKAHLSLEERFADAAKEDMESFLEAMYPKLVRNTFSQKQWQNFFDILLENEEGATLYHCTGGKDRVGTATVLLLSALGVEEKLIIADFLKTNTLLKDFIEKSLKSMEARVPDPLMRQRIGKLMGVEKSYIDALYKTVNEEFKGMSSYLEKQIGLTPNKITKLKSMYLTSL